MKAIQEARRSAKCLLRDGVVYLSGSKYLGRMVGTFSFSAAATDTCFNANYSSCKDNGTFKLSRCSYGCGK